MKQGCCTCRIICWIAAITGLRCTPVVETLHNQPNRGKRGIFGAEIGRYRFAGLTPLDGHTATVRTKIFFLSSERLLLDARIDGTLRAELCNAFGQPLTGLSFADSVPVSGDSTRHELRWKQAGADAYLYYPVSLRLEWTHGTVFSFS